MQTVHWTFEKGKKSFKDLPPFFFFFFRNNMVTYWYLHLSIKDLVATGAYVFNSQRRRPGSSDYETDLAGYEQS